jgi:3-methyl-2-oxobutanoate hydroxymethyltransferase
MICKMKGGEKIVTLTAYDFPTARIADEVGVDLILVGDSLGMVVLGYENTLPVTMGEMLHHTRAVARAKPRALVVADLPYRSYETVTQAVRNARRFVTAGADAVKLEGGSKNICALVRAVVRAGIPVLGHIGLIPQSIEKMGGYRVQGKTPAEAQRLMKEAKALEQAGAFGMVLECIPAHLASRVTRHISIPTIGIGAGRDCDGQILVSHDLLGFGAWGIPKHARRYAHLAKVIRRAFAAYGADVRAGNFPTAANSF